MHELDNARVNVRALVIVAGHVPAVNAVGCWACGRGHRQLANGGDLPCGCTAYRAQERVLSEIAKIGEVREGVEGMEYCTSCLGYAVAKEGVEEERLAARDESN